MRVTSECVRVWEGSQRLCDGVVKTCVGVGEVCEMCEGIEGVSKA